MKPTGGAIRQHNQSVLDGFVAYRKATKGLTKRDEQWLNQMLGRYLRYVQIPVEAAQPTELAQFLAPYADHPFQRHGLYRALKSFYGWLKRLRYISDNPMEYIDPPKVPDRILNTVSPEQARILIDSASCTRDKAIVALFADSGARRGEVVGIRMRDVDLVHSRIRVDGKGGKEGYLLFGPATQALLAEYIDECGPTDKLFTLNYEGIKTMLRRLGDKTGIVARPHDFRRGFATTLRRMGVGELDIAQMGRWSSLEMVRRYTKAYSFEDAASRYQAVVR